jgi:hypothetical protein
LALSGPMGYEMKCSSSAMDGGNMVTDVQRSNYLEYANLVV